MQYMEDNPFPGSFSVWLCYVLFDLLSLTMARGSPSNARKRLIAVKSIQDLSAGKRDIFF